jgi:hypothetical protein
MSAKKRLLYALIAGLGLLTALAVSSCGGAASTSMPASDWDEAPAEEAAEEPAFEVEAEPASAEEMAPPAEEAAAPDATGAEDDQMDALAAALPQDRLIIKNGQVALLVEDVDVAVDRVTQIAVDNGGYVLSSQVYPVGSVKGATVTLAVDSNRFEAAMRRLREIATEVLSETTSGEDVTAEYVDLESRLRNLEATRDRILTFLDEAKTVEEALKVNEELAQVEAEIEQVKGRMNYLAGRSSFSTITVNLEMPAPTPTPTPVPTVTPTPTPTPTPAPWSLGPRLKSAAGTQVKVFQGLTEALAWIVIVPGPYLLALAVIVYVVRRFVRPQGAGQSDDESGSSG